MTKETKFISIKQAMKQGEGQVDLRGWVHRERGSNKLKFVVLRDSSSTIQCVFEKKDIEDKWEQIDKLKLNLQSTFTEP